jgi:hypothetical protein
LKTRGSNRNSVIFFVLVFAALIVFFQYKHSFNAGSLSGAENKKQEEKKDISPLNGLSCDNYNRRPIAVMLANDEVARPLSGLSEADMVFEMQVVEDSITRLMAVFVCNSPEDLGSIRSARHNFIPLAMGLDAIYAHWGGSHFALEKLNKGIADNIDAMKNPYEAFFRKLGISAPHNGFSTIEKLTASAGKLKYRLENNFEGYLHQISNSKSQNPNTNVKINYAYPWNVEWEYDGEKNVYSRFRGGRAEIDKNNNQQIEAGNIVVMFAKSRPLEGQYNDVDVEGEGEIILYQNSEEIKGKWKKDRNNLKSKLYFFDESGQEVKFVPGQIWVEIIEPGK